MKKTGKKLLAVLLSVLFILSSFALTASAAPSDEGLAKAREIEAEGIVLVKNDDAGLPLAHGAKISVFGATQLNAANYLGGGGSGSISTANAVYLLPALRTQGFQLNEPLVNTYQTWWDGGGRNADYRPKDETPTEGEYTSTAVAHAEMEVTDEMITGAKAFSDTAVIVIGRSGSEGLDLGTADIGLYPGEVAMIDKVAKSFNRVIVLFNICTTIEMGILEQYPSIKSAAIIWAPGEVGMTSVAQMLDGTVNPSGKLADTVAYSIFDHPSTANFGDIVKPQTAEEYVAVTPGYYGSGDKYYVQYEEDIYVGYRYFETPEFKALGKVQYEFGYGLSYTTFDVKLADFIANEETITVVAQVTNTGAVAGKEVVQAYYGAPDGELEKPGKELVAYGKTSLLAPGASQFVKLEFNTDEMASYSEARAAYILEAGNYNIYLGTSVKKVDLAGVYKLASMKINKYDAETGAEIKNLFPDAQGGITLLSKKNIEATYPTAPARGVRHVPGSGWSATGANAITSSNTGGRFTLPGVMPALVNNTIQLGTKPLAAIQLKEVYADPSKMDAFLAQFTDEELITMQANGGFKTIGIARLGIPATNSQDGPACVKAVSRSGQTNGTAFPIGTAVACTWNQQLAYDMGVIAGKEAAALNVHSWYAPGADAHRNPMGGRNFEYFSEDPMLGGTIMASMVMGAQSEGLTPTIKHYAINDQEANRCGVETYLSERAFREIYLKQFEYSIKIGGLGIMASFSRIGTTWCGASSALLNDLTRTEWGFKGFVLSDAWIGGYMSVIDATYGGCDTMLGFGTNGYKTLPDFSAEFAANPTKIRAALEKCAENILNYVMTTRAFSTVLGSEENLNFVANDAMPFEVDRATLYAAPQKASINTKFSLSFAIDSQYTGFVLMNENGGIISVSDVVKTANGPQTRYDASTSVGTAGNREIRVLGKLADGSYRYTGLIIKVAVTQTSEEPIVKSVVAPASAKVNVASNYAITTNDEGSYSANVKSKGAASYLGKTVVSKTKNTDGTYTWVIAVKIGSAGKRDLEAYAGSKIGAVSAAYPFQVTVSLI